VGSRIEETDEFAVEVQPAALMVRDDDLGEQERIHLREHVKRQIFRHFRRLHIERAERMAVIDGPEGIPSGTQGFDEEIVDEVECERSVGDFDDGRRRGDSRIGEQDVKPANG